MRNEKWRRNRAVKTQTLKKRSLILSLKPDYWITNNTIYWIWRLIMFWTSFGNLKSFKQTFGSMNLCLYPSSSQKLWCLKSVRTSLHHMLKTLWLLWYYINHTLWTKIWFLVTYIFIQWPRLKNYSHYITADGHFCFEFLYIPFGGCKYLNSTLLQNFHQVTDNMMYGWRFLPAHAMGDVMRTICPFRQYQRGVKSLSVFDSG